jgi:hypothetical protein
MYTKTIVWGSLYFVLTIALIITLKPMSVDSSGGFQYQSQSYAANNISDTELSSFLSVNNAMIVLKEYTREQLLLIMSEHGITKERYNQIADMENDPFAESDATEEEREIVGIISHRIAELEFEIQQQMFSVTSEYRLTAQRFLEINELLENDPDLRRRFDKIVQSEKQSRKMTSEFNFRFCLIS